MSFKYYLPDENNNRIEHLTETNSVVIIGANGSGKTKLGEWIEKNFGAHRIGAQRSLTFGDYITQRSHEQATNLLIFGHERAQQNHNSRWAWDGEKNNYTASLLNDYEYVLSLLIALKNKEQEDYLSICRERDQGNQTHDPVPDTVADILKKIWIKVFPQRDISLDDAKVTAIYAGDAVRVKYKGKDMSDGERVALYLIAQALCIPKKRTIIIDEPEIHLHRSIMSRLWAAIEEARNDCLFIYITHDTQFAASHAKSQKLWVKSTAVPRK